jgi:hypothetical protein
MAAVFSLFSLLNCSPAEAASFKDLGSGDQCLPYVNYLVSKDVVKGFPDGTFQPGGTVTRAQMAQMLTKAQALSAATGPALNFTDVGPNHWAYQTISQAVQSGYIAGYPDGTFRPEAPATRAEMAAMLLRLTRAQMPELTSPSSVTDLNGHWAAQPAAVALDAGLISLDAAGKFAPDKPASRAEVAKGLALMLTLNPEQNQVELSAALIPVKGKVQIVKANGTVIEATTTTPCGKGDTVITGSNSTAQLQFPDGSGFKINENSRLTIKEAMGRAAILPDGKEGVMIDNLEVELPEGQIFGALASTYQNSAVEDSSNAADRV